MFTLRAAEHVKKSTTRGIVTFERSEKYLLLQSLFDDPFWLAISLHSEISAEVYRSVNRYS